MILLYYVLVYNVGKNIPHGHVFVEGAPLLKKEGIINKYDWENKKISLQLNTNDLDIIIYNLNTNTPFSIKKNNKRFYVEKNLKTLIFILEHEDIKLEVPLTYENVIGLNLLLSQAKVRIYSW